MQRPARLVCGTDNYNLVYHLNQDLQHGTVDEFVDASGTGNDGTGGGRRRHKKMRTDVNTYASCWQKLDMDKSFDGANIRSASNNAMKELETFIWINEVGSWPIGLTPGNEPWVTD